MVVDRATVRSSATVSSGAAHPVRFPLALVDSEALVLHVGCIYLCANNLARRGSLLQDPKKKKKKKGAGTSLLSFGEDDEHAGNVHEFKSVIPLSHPRSLLPPTSSLHISHERPLLYFTVISVCVFVDYSESASPSRFGCCCSYQPDRHCRFGNLAAIGLVLDISRRSRQLLMFYTFNARRFVSSLICTFCFFLQGKEKEEEKASDSSASRRLSSRIGHQHAGLISRGVLGRAFGCAAEQVRLAVLRNPTIVGQLTRHPTCSTVHYPYSLLSALLA
jgi:hypothetical protein